VSYEFLAGAKIIIIRIYVYLGIWKLLIANPARLANVDRKSTPTAQNCLPTLDKEA
jgi:hypothetical protein